MDYKTSFVQNSPAHASGETVVWQVKVKLNEVDKGCSIGDIKGSSGGSSGHQLLSVARMGVKRENGTLFLYLEEQSF